MKKHLVPIQISQKIKIWNFSKMDLKTFHMSNSRKATNKTIKILYWNARSLNKYKKELTGRINDFDVFACVESWLKEDQEIKYPGYKCYRKDRLSSRAGGIAVYIRENLEYTEITNLCDAMDNVEICGIKLLNRSPELNLIICYRIPGFCLSQEQWDSLIINAFLPNSNCLFVGNFNAHHTTWNCSHNDPNGV